MTSCCVQSPVGPLYLEADDEGLCAVLPSSGPLSPPETPLLREACAQLDAYFAGSRRAFDLPLHMTGTPFQRSAWHALLRIPFGQTRTYAQQAAALGSPRAFRAVGQANHHNRLMIVVPCHRIVGADGSLTGYAGGVPMKAWLLRHEQAVARSASGAV